MNTTRVLALALGALASAAALHPARAAAQTDTAAVTVSRGQAGEVAPGTDVPVSAVPRARRSLNTITYEEVRTSRVADAYEVVYRLRPSWLRSPRGMVTFGNTVDVAVFFNGIRMGTRDALKSIPITSIRTLRFYTATEARQKFGGDTFAGAIEVLSQ
ncbi:hypothetical protein SAMN05216486_10482 [bacterium JGI 053]|nr:hypothetical protein SAMN05216486_10482 [bacterium JGI 053]